MDWYSAIKFLHVVSAIVWVGGAFVMIMLGANTARTSNDSEVVGVVLHVGWIGHHIYMPASLATLVFGLALATIGSLWETLWVPLGLIGIVVSIAIAITALTPLSKKLAIGFKTSGVTPAIVTTAHRILRIAKFDIVLLLVIVADMVLRPSTSDTAILAIMAIVLVVAAALWLVPGVRRAPKVA